MELLKFHTSIHPLVILVYEEDRWQYFWHIWAQNRWLLHFVSSSMAIKPPQRSPMMVKKSWDHAWSGIPKAFTQVCSSFLIAMSKPDIGDHQSRDRCLPFQNQSPPLMRSASCFEGKSNRNMLWIVIYLGNFETCRDFPPVYKPLLNHFRVGAYIKGIIEDTNKTLWEELSFNTFWWGTCFDSLLSCILNFTRWPLKDLCCFHIRFGLLTCKIEPWIREIPQKTKYFISNITPSRIVIVFWDNNSIPFNSEPGFNP